MSAATMGPDSGPNPNLNLTPEEKRVYGQLFRQADADGVGVVTGEIAVKFFEKTRLDSRVLGEIWQIADKENRGFLTPAGFSIVLRLIGHAQAGREPAVSVALQPGPLPRFDGISSNLGSPPATPTGLQAQTTGGPGNRPPPLTPEKAAQYAALFERQALQAGNLLPGEQARQIFDRSNLPNDVLSKIWELSDTEQRGALVQTEFIIAMHLLTSMKTGSLRALPNVLPAALYEAATNRGAPARQSPSSTGTGLSAIPRQMSGSTQPRTGSPLGRPPIGPLGAGPSDWPITPADKAKFDQIYSTLDKTNKGFITGDEAVPFFSQSNLSEDDLAQIWDLADFNSQGTLSRDGFAVAMYLIKEHRSGRISTLPQTLPENLKPPSLRNRAPPAPATPVFNPPPVQRPPPPQPKSALDDLFGLDSGSSSPVPAQLPAPLPTQAPMSTGGSTANDPFAGGPIVPSSPTRQTPSTSTNNFKPFIPSSSFGRGLATHPTGDSAGSTPRQASASDDLLSDNDDASRNITNDSTELANLSNQISSLSKQTQDTQAKRAAAQTDLANTNSQKANFEQRLAQLRTAYEKEAREARALEEQLQASRKATSKLQGDCMASEGQLRDIQQQHEQLQASYQQDQQENSALRERIRVVNAEIAQLKPQIEKLKSDARQQKGLVAINKKQLSTTESERDKLKSEAEDLTKKNEEAAREAAASPPPPADVPPPQVASPALSQGSGNNPFFRRTASTDIMGAVAPTPPTRNFSDISFDDVFGPSNPSEAPTPAAAFQQQHTGTSSNYSTPQVSSPAISRQGTMTADPPAPPDSRQLSSSFLPLPEHEESLSSSRQVSPPASRAEGSGPDAISPFPGVPISDNGSNIPGAFPGEEEIGGIREETASTALPIEKETDEEAVLETTKQEAGKPDPFSNDDDSKAKADFENAFAAFTSSNKKKETATEAPKPPAAFDHEFPPISEVEQDDDSDSENEQGGFDDDFAPVPAAQKLPEVSHSDTPPAVPLKDGPFTPNTTGESGEQVSSPATITHQSNVASDTTADDIFGQAAAPAASAEVHPTTQSALGIRGAFDDLDDDFEGLEDAKEGSADDDFATISRSGFDDFNPVFDSSPPGSQAKSESTAFGHESGFDFVSRNSAASAAPPHSQANGGPAKGADNHDWDAIFAGLDETPAATQAPSQPIISDSSNHIDNLSIPPPPAIPVDKIDRPQGPGRALTETGEHDDPILKNLTGMGYSRKEALAALEKYDYDLERAANHLANES